MAKHSAADLIAIRAAEDVAECGSVAAAIARLETDSKDAGLPAAARKFFRSVIAYLIEKGGE